jgi:hypothetical protein
MIIVDISHKYSLRKNTSSSGESFSDMLVNHSRSEKNIATFLFSPSRFTFQVQDNISDAISSETYSDSALFNFAFCLFSNKYFTVLDRVRDIINAKSNSTV